MTSNTVCDSPNANFLGFYTPAEASRIAQVSLWTVHDWRRKGIVVPTVQWTDEVNKLHIGHDFETVVFLRLIKLLRDSNISLIQSVKAVQQLNTRLGPPSKRWANARIFVLDKEVIVSDTSDGYGSTNVTKGHQVVWEVFFGERFKRLKERADALLIPDQYMNYVEIDPAVQNGLPLILDTSILTSTIHKWCQRGYGCDYAHEMYPFVPLEKIKGAEEYESFLDKVGRN